MNNNTKYKVGEAVRLKGGTYRGLCGTVVYELPKDKFRVKLNRGFSVKISQQALEYAPISWDTLCKGMALMYTGYGETTEYTIVSMLSESMVVIKLRNSDTNDPFMASIDYLKENYTLVGEKKKEIVLMGGKSYDVDIDVFDKIMKIFEKSALSSSEIIKDTS